VLIQLSWWWWMWS